jgi:hypothetical protein
MKSEGRREEEEGIIIIIRGTKWKHRGKGEKNTTIGKKSSLPALGVLFLHLTHHPPPN